MKSNKKKLSKLSPRERAMAGLLKINNTPVTAPVANGDTIHDIKSFTKAENEREAVEAARLQLVARGFEGTPCCTARDPVHPPFEVPCRELRQCGHD